MENQNGAKDLTKVLDVSTVREMMYAIEVEIGQVKNGELPEGKARVVKDLRRLQMRGVEVTIQAARLERSLVKELKSQFIAPPPSAALEGAKTEEAKPNPVKADSAVK